MFKPSSPNMMTANEKTQATPTCFEGLLIEGLLFERIFFKNNSQKNLIKFFCNFYLHYQVKFYVKYFKKYVVSKFLKPIYKSFLCLKTIVTMFNECF